MVRIWEGEVDASPLLQAGAPAAQRLARLRR
jgi:hypothetical protein